MRQRLERLGRYELDPIGGGLGHAIEHYVVPLVDYCRAGEAEQESFLRDLAVVVAGDQGGFATYGAASLAWKLFGEKALRLPAALPLIDAGIQLEAGPGLPPVIALTGYELRRFGQWPDVR